MPDLYDIDLAAWAEQQIEALRRLAEVHPDLVPELDLPHLVEELDDMKKSLAHDLTSRLAVVMLHLAKWRWQPGKRSRSWENSAGRERDRIALLLEENPSLRRAIPERVPRAWRLARRDAARETALRLDTFPDACPFTIEQTLDEAYWPD